MKATEQYFPVVLFIMLYKMAGTFDSVYEMVQCDLSYERAGAINLRLSENQAILDISKF